VIWLYAVVAAAGLAIIAFGVLDASPLVNFGTAEELESIRRGRDRAVDGAVIAGLAALALALVGETRWAALVAIAAAVPVALVLLAGDTALGLFSLALWPVLVIVGVRRTSKPAG
jgi:hypothetical protein